MEQLKTNTILQGGKYKIERVLGQGGFGITYLALQISLQRKVAIKEFFMSDLCSRETNTLYLKTCTGESEKHVKLYRNKFIKEARNLARLHHSNIINVIDVFEENNTVYYVMPYYSGGSLQEYVETNGVLSETEAMKYVRQIAKALKYMHEEEHICHFDVKPANILLDDNGNSVLIDFGISKNYDESGHETTMTPVGMSDGYAPIEQYQQKVEDFSPASDVYALGATLYFLLHGKKPVSAVHRAGGISLKISNSISPELKEIINASMKIIKQERANSVDIFLRNTNCFINSYQINNFDKNIIKGKSLSELEYEAIAYYEKNDIQILNQYGFFKQKKKRQASTIWASCIICFILSIILGAIVIEHLGIEHSGTVGFFIYIFAIILGIYPGLTIGPAIIGLSDKTQFNDLAENIKKQFIKDYIEKNRK